MRFVSCDGFTEKYADNVPREHEGTHCPPGEKTFALLKMYVSVDTENNGYFLLVMVN